MAKKATYDVIVIGSGSAGFSAIEGALSLGASVCVIEKGKFGGECPNAACVPSKAVLKAAKIYRQAQHAREYGIELGRLSYDFSQIMKYRESVVSQITGGGEFGDRYIKILDKLKVHRRQGAAEFIDDHIVQVNGENLYGKTIVIATGTVDFIPPIKGINDIKLWSWKKALSTSRQPKTLGIIGGGPVGCEIATFYASFETRVTILQAAPFVLNREDKEISELAGEALSSIGVEVITNAKISELLDAQGGVKGIRLENGSSQNVHAFEQIVVATGKRSNVDGLHLETTGVLLDKRGWVSTDKNQQTSVSHIFAAGDVDGGMQFTHTAHHEGWTAGYNAALKALKKRTKSRQIDERVVPRATFIDPEVASVGMTGEQVKEKYGKVLVGRYGVGALGRAVTDNARFGLIKLVAHPKTRKVLGAHMIGGRAGDVIHEAALAIYLNASIDKLAGMIHAFPTYSEGLKAAAASAIIE